MNVVCLVGRVVADPEVKTLASGSVLASMRIAVDRPVAKDAEVTADFISLSAFGKTAEFASKYITKGQKISVQGRLQIRDYTDKDGNKRTAAEVLVNDLRGVDRPSGGGNAQGGGNYQPSGNRFQNKAQNAPQRASRPFDEPITDPFAE